MSSGNHWRSYMTPMACNICTCAVFATISFNFGLPTYFVSHYCYGRALYAVFFYRRVFFKVEQSCLTVVCQMTCQRSHICWCASCWHHVFVLLVQSALIYFENLILSSLARDWCCFPSRRLPYTLICSSIFCFLEIDVCVYPSLCWLCSLSDILARHDSNTVCRGSRKNSLDYFVCSICRCGIDQALFHQLKVFG